MQNEALALMAWSYGCAAVGYAIYALYLIHLARTTRSGSRVPAMLVAVLVSSVWGGFGLAFALSGETFFLVLDFLADIGRYGSWYIFLLLLIHEGRGGLGRTGLMSWLGGVAVGLVGAGVVIHVSNFAVAGFADILSRAALYQALAMIVFGLVLVEQLFRNLSDDSRWNVKPLCLGLLGAFAFDLYLFADALLFNRFDTDAYQVRGFVHTLTLPLLVIATLRTRDWTSRIRLSQKAAFHSATLLIAGVYLLFMAGVGYYVRYFGGDWGRALQLATLFAALLLMALLAVSEAMRAKLRVLVGKHFFRYRYDYREEWLRFTRTLSEQTSPQAMGEQVILGLANMVESPGGTLWLLSPDGNDYRQMAVSNTTQVAYGEPADSSLATFLRDSGWVINLEEMRAYPHRYKAFEVPEWVSATHGAWLIVPLFTSSGMIGFVVLLSARTYMDINWEVNDLLRTAGRQAASFLAQMQATEALLEARKFEAFNKMSAFVVHDLKNIVTQLALMLRNAERHKDNPEFQQDMLMTVDNAVGKMRQLMLQLREGGTPLGASVGVDLVSVIRRLQAAKARQGRNLDVDIVDAVFTRGAEERMERVVGHLVQNALDATPVDGKVWIRLQREAGQAVLEVGDTGQGMSSEFVRERLFKPFQTTKDAGMGIGAYESFQYVQELGGKVQVESEVGVGTRISVMLPVLEKRTGSDLHAQEAAV